MRKSDSHAPVISPFILLTETSKTTGCPRPTILKYSRLGQFPKEVRLLGNRIAFNRADVQDWIDSRVTSAKGVA